MRLKKHPQFISSCRRAGLSLAAGVILLAGTFLASAADPVNPDTNADARELLDYLEGIYGQSTIAGLHTFYGNVYDRTGVEEALTDGDFGFGTIDPDATKAIENWNEQRKIKTYQWHWHFDGDDAWAGRRDNPVDVGAMVTPGTPEYAQAMIEIDEVGDALESMEAAGIPILFRPLHEIDGGWFWWTDKDNPENTAELWRMIYNRLAVERNIDNLIWVFNYATGTSKTVEYRSAFYPGDEYVDISGLDIYNADYIYGTDVYQDYWDVIAAVSPGKMLAMGETDALPDPQLMADGTTPRWLWIMPWFATHGYGGIDWMVYSYTHPYMLKLDDLPFLGSGNVMPHVGIVDPLDDGEGRFAGDNKPVIEVEAVDRGGSIDRVEMYAEDTLIGTLTSAPYTFTWTDVTPGIYRITAKAFDNEGNSTTSNSVRVSYDVVNLALNQPVTVSSGSNAENAVDGSYWTSWRSDKNDATPEEEFIYVDLGGEFDVSTVGINFGWKIYAKKYSIDLATADPAVESNWTTVFEDNSSWGDSTEYPHKVTFFHDFPTTTARYVRVKMWERRENWGGYNFTELEVPVPNTVMGENDAPTIVTPAAASDNDTIERYIDLSVEAEDADRDYLTYTWEVVSGDPANVEIAPNSTIFSEETTAYFGAPGLYTLRVSVDDLRGGTVTSEIDVNILPVIGSYLTDDMSTDSNGLNETNPVSKWQKFAMRFALEEGINVGSATLRIYRRDRDTRDIVGTLMTSTNDAWDEVNGGHPTNGTSVGDVPSTEGGVWLEWDVTSFVQEQVAGDGYASFVFKTDQTDWSTGIHTRQNAVNPPELVIVEAQTELNPTDDKSRQSGDGLGEIDAVSKWNRWASQFDLSGVSTVNSAKLRIYRDDDHNPPAVEATLKQGKSDSWTEIDSNFPGSGDVLGTLTADAGGGYWMEFDVTAFVQAEHAGDGVVTFVLHTDQGSWNTRVHTRQSTEFPPVLIIE